MSILKRLIFTAIVWAISTNTLTAAPCWTWNGFYAGVNLGIIRCYDKLNLTPKGLWGAESAALQDFIGGNGTTRLSNWNFIGGGQAGYNFQACCWLFGLEVDGNYVNLSDHRRTAQLPFDDLLSYSFREHIEHHWLVTVRPRLGRVFKTRFMTYLTGGYATGDVKVRSKIIGELDGYQSFASTSKVLNGWTLGGGLEYALRPHFTVKAEYLYVHLGHFKTTSAPGPGFAGFFEQREYSIREDAIRIGLNYRL